MNVFYSTNVKAARRVDGDEQILVILNFPCDDDLLLVAARKRSGGTFFTVARTDVELLYGFRSIFEDLIPVEDTLL